MNGLTRKLKKKLKKYMEVNKNENMTVRNLWDEAKAVIREKYIAMQAFLKNKISIIQSNPTPKVSGRRTANKD